MASEGANGRLIEALEEADLDQIKRSLRAGANPNEARKRVTLNVRMPDGTTRSDSQYMEPPLALAIRSGRADVVRALLEAAQPPTFATFCLELNEQAVIPTQKSSGALEGGILLGVTQSRWDNERWDDDEALKFASALEFSLTRGRRLFNFPGREVLIRNPTDGDAVCVWISLLPQLEVVRVLLEGGATVTPTALIRAKALKIPNLFELVQDHATKQPPLSPVATSPTTVAALQAAFPQLVPPPSENPRRIASHNRQSSKGIGGLAPTGPEAPSELPPVNLAVAAEPPAGAVLEETLSNPSPSLAPSPLPSESIVDHEVELPATVADLRAVLVEREARIAELDARVAELEGDLDATVDDLQRVLANKDSDPADRDREGRKRMVELENAVRERDERLALLETEMREREDRLQELEEMLRERDERVLALEDERQRLEDANGLFGSISVEHLNDKNEHIAGPADMEAADVATDASDSADPSAIIRGLRAVIRERDARIARLVEADEGKRAAMEALRGQLLSIEERLRDSEAAHSRTKADRTERLTTMGNELGAAQRQAQEARGQVRAREERITKLMNQIALLEEDLGARAAGDENEMAAYVDSLRAQVTERDDRIAELEEEMYKGYRQTADELRQLKENVKKGEKLQKSAKEDLTAVLEAEVQQLQKQLTAEREFAEELKEQRRWLEIELSSERARNADVATMQEGLMQRGLTPDPGSSTNRIRALESELAGARTQVEDLVAERERLLQELRKVRIEPDNAQLLRLENELAAERSRAVKAVTTRERLERAVTEENAIRAEEARLRAVAETDLQLQRKRVAELEWVLQNSTVSGANGMLSGVGRNGNGTGKTNGSKIVRPRDLPIATHASLPAIPAPVKRVLYVVSPYEPREKDELALNVGERVVSLFQYADGWSAGLNKSTVQSGFFPSACLSPDATAVSEIVVIPPRTMSSSKKGDGRSRS
ncbi:hypothetical protein HDU93_009786 [Gonapodya sp. JEL0774]|nr:hypothetical protein HDU93_009786 [Gonapodya sp. JEL0774]